MRLNPVLQPILTVTIVTVNMGCNTRFSPVTDLNEGCSLLRMLKPNVWRGVCSSVRLDTDIFIGTSMLNFQTLKSFFYPNSSDQNDFARKLGGVHFFSSICGPNMSLYSQILLPKQWLSEPTCLLWPKPYLKTPIACFFFNQKLRLLKIFKFWIWLRFSRYGFFAILKYVKIPKTVKNLLDNKNVL